MDGTDELVATKAALRRSTSRARRSLEPDQRVAANAAICRRLLGLSGLVRAGTVLAYAPMAEEADPTGAVSALRERGTRTLLPRVRGDELDLVQVADGHGLTVGFRGILEPVGPALDPFVVDAVLVPGLAFDLAGGRTGHGGGHYDRLLARLPDDCLRIGVAFSCQVVPRAPMDLHDEVVDVVVTEASTHHTGARGVDVPG